MRMTFLQKLALSACINKGTIIMDLILKARR